MGLVGAGWGWLAGSVRAAAVGLDRERLRALESALQAVYEQRHRVKIAEVEDAGLLSSTGVTHPIEPASAREVTWIFRDPGVLGSMAIQLCS